MIQDKEALSPGTCLKNSVLIFIYRFFSQLLTNKNG